MIEIICNQEDDDKSKETISNSQIRRPKNIKQIGDVSSDKTIYIEDYAFTYINSLAYANLSEEQAGVLLGGFQKTQEEKCIFIKGVIKAKTDDTAGHEGIAFDENVWRKVYMEIEKYFPNLQIVGWFATTSNVNPETMEYLRKIHVDNFSGNMKTLYLVNTAEKEESFYLYDNGQLRKQKGYVCFYERNYEMQEYMMEKRGKRLVEKPQTDKVVKSIRNIIQEKEIIHQQRKNTVTMYGVTAFMAVVLLVVGFNLVNSYEKMQSFDKSLNNIAREISGMNDDAVEVVKVDGKVYPTQAPTQPLTQAPTQASTQTPTQPVTEAVTESVAKTDEAKSTQTAKSKVTTYVIQKGDTIIGICKKYYGDANKANEVIDYNGIADANKLYVGQEIKLP